MRGRSLAESKKGQPPSPASDVYSLGVVLYEMLTGRLPFIGSTPSELSRLHRIVPPTPPSQLNPLIPPSVEQACLKVLSKEPSSRYRTADQFGRVLISLNRSIKAPSAEVAQPLKTPTSVIQMNSNQVQGQSQPPIPPLTSASKKAVSISTQRPALTGKQSAYPQNALDIDWLTWGLVLLTVLSLGGLIPFWIWVYLLYNPPGG